MKKIFCLVLPLILMTGFFSRMEAASMKVGPAGFMVHNIVPGRTYDVYKEAGLQLTIYNDSDLAKTYLLSMRRPSEGGAWEKGYQEIPDPKWCWFDQTEITVEANSNAFARFHLRIPEEDHYYNQHWVVTLNIAGKPGSGIGVGVAINVRAQIETQSRANLKGIAPDAIIGVVPSVITLKAEDKGEIVIFNNSATNETYKIYALTDKEKFQKYISAGFLPLPEASWLMFGDGSQDIPAGGSKTLSLKSALREKENKPENKYESVIFVEGQGATGFLRVRILGTEEKTGARNQESGGRK